MRVQRHFDNLPAAATGSVVVIGNFDGLHRGHQAVIGAAVRLARTWGRPAALLTFEPHPRRFFRPDAPPFLLTRFRSKARIAEAFGIDRIFVLRFDATMAKRSAEDFIDEILLRGLAARHVVVGYDFVFGQGRRGSPELLRARLAESGIGTTVMPPVTAPDPATDAEPDGLIYSSTGVRDCLQQGDPRGAARLLGRPFEIEGRVVLGDRRGRTLGFPTANLWLGDYLRPMLGVYAVRVGIATGAETSWHDGVANLGMRPTFGGTEPRLEAHLFDFAGDLYGRRLRICLSEFLRPERKFDGIDALRAQIAADCAEARAVLAKTAGRAGLVPTT